MEGPRWRGRRGQRGARPPQVRAVPERAHGTHLDALRPCLLLALHRGLAQPEAGVPAVPLQLHNLEAGLCVPQRLLVRCIVDWHNQKTECPLCRSSFTTSKPVCVYHSDF